MRRYILGCWLWISVLGVVRAQSPTELLNITDLRVSAYQSDETTAARTFSVWPDRRGFIWFATSKGLVRYDGINYKHYHHQPGQPRSLGGNSVKEIRESPTGELFLALFDEGMSRFNPYAPDSAAFTNYTHNPTNSNSLPTNELYAIETDNAGIVWLGGRDSGLIRFDPRQNRFTVFRWPKTISDAASQGIYDIMADPDGSLWLGTEQSGLLRYWPDKQRFEKYNMQPVLPPNVPFGNAVGSFALDKSGNILYFGSLALGVCRLDKRTGQITPLPITTRPTDWDNATYAMSLFTDKTGLLWVANSGQGLFRYNPRTNTTQSIPLKTTPTEKLTIEYAHPDRNGLVWISTSRGILKYSQTPDAGLRRYPVLSRTRLNAARPGRAGQPIRGIIRAEQDKRGDFWLEFTDRIARYDTTQRRIMATIALPSDLLKSGLKRLQLVGNQVFLLSYNGLYLLDARTNRIKKLPVTGTDEAANQFRDIGANALIIADTSAGQPVLWAGQQRLYRYWVKTGRVESIRLGTGRLEAQNIEALCRDHNGVLWICSGGQGLFRIDDKQTGQATQFLNQPGQPNTLPTNILSDIRQDYRNNLWIATLWHGMVRVNQHGKSVLFSTSGTGSAAPPNHIILFWEDHAHIFWLTTREGLFFFNPATGQYRKHAPTDQLLFKTNRYGIMPSPDGYPITVADGVILKGADAGAMFAVPENSPLHFTDFQIFNHPHPELLADSVAGIHLSPTQNQFSISFAAPWFRHPEQIRYRYQLVGFDRNWIEADARREGVYTNIPHGQYTFRVQASWDGTDTFIRTISLPIVVAPAWYETVWFAALLLALAGAVVWAVWHYRQRDIQTRADLRVAQAEQRQYETELREQDAVYQRRLADTEMTALRAQMNPHFIFNCLNSIKLYTLQNDTDKASDYLTKFARLIRLVLENSRADRITLQNELEALQLYSDLEAMRFKEKVTIAIVVAPDIDQQFVTIPPLLLQPYVENAIWHGLMHKPDGGTVTVSVSQPTDQLLHIEIIDDGIGRARATALKSKSAGKGKSFGMQATADRIRMINELYNTQTNARILDLVAPDGEPLGTTVVLEIPV